MPVSRHTPKMIPALSHALPQRVSRFPFALILLAVYLVAVPIATWAQVTTGSILGTVYDVTGAALSNATITATNLANGVTRQGQSNSSGYYTLPSLPPGNYKVVATAPSFKAAGTELQVALGQAANFEFHLSPGSIDQSIQVDASSSALALETSSHEVGTVMPSQKIENLPANGRTVFQTLQSATNVSPFQNAAGPISNFRTTSNNVTIGGSASGTTSYLQDGVTNIAVLTKTANFQPHPERRRSTL
jgi:Carboxypeptidase regulatory-like domain